MTQISRVLNLENLLPFEIDVLGCDPVTNRHVFVDTTGCAPLRCLCAEHRWEDDGFTAIYYPALPYAQQEPAND